jgi:hypothetical protein
MAISFCLQTYWHERKWKNNFFGRFISANVVSSIGSKLAVLNEIEKSDCALKYKSLKAIELLN